MSASPAAACKAALAQATKRWPKRDKSSDGIMGDAAHQARVSDHNQGNAFDLTHDPKHGPDCAKIAPLMPKDKRVKYVIFNRRIWSREKPYWHAYTGENPHTAHMHVSIKDGARGDTSPWPGIAEPAPKPATDGPRKAVMLADHTAPDHAHPGTNATAHEGGTVTVLRYDKAPGTSTVEWGGHRIIVPSAKIKFV